MVRVGHEKEGKRPHPSPHRPHPSPHRVVKGQQRSTQMGRQKRAEEEEEELLGGGQLDATQRRERRGNGGTEMSKCCASISQAVRSAGG